MWRKRPAQVALHRAFAGQRQKHPERRSPARLAVDGDVPAVFLDDIVHDRQSEPRALLEALGREEGLEYLFPDCRVHPGPGIGHRDNGVGTRLPVSAVLDELAVQLRDARLQGHGPAVRHGVSRVDQQVHENALDLVAVRQDGQLSPGIPQGQNDLPADQAGEKLLHIPHNIVQVAALQADHLFFAEGEQRLRHVRRALGRGEDMVHMGPQRFVPVHLHVQDVRVSYDGGQDVVEVVGHTSGELADRLHLLRAPQLPLERLALGDVEERPDHRRFPLVLDRRRGHEGPALGAVLSDDLELVLGREHIVLRARAAPLLYHVPEIGMHDAPEVHGKELLVRVAGHGLAYGVRVR